MKQFDEYDQDELRELLIAQVKKDKMVMLERGIFIAPWIDADFILNKPELKLLTRIADNGGWLPHEKEDIRAFLGFKSVNNSTAVIRSLIKKDCVESDDGYLKMTHYGTALLEHLEEIAAF